MFRTPGGNTSLSTSASRRQESGACSGGLDNDSIAGCERRGNLASGKHQRVVVCNNARDHPQWLTQRVMQTVSVDRDGLAFQHGDQASKKVQRVGRNHRVANHLRNGIARVDGIDHGELFRMLAKQACSLVQHALPFCRGRTSPVEPGFMGALDGSFGVICTCMRNRRDRKAVRRIKRFPVGRAERFMPVPRVKQSAGARETGILARWRFRHWIHRHCCLPLG